MTKNMAVLLLFLLSLLSVLEVQAENWLLTRRVPNLTQYKPGYIKNAVIVVEPHGAYTEQSLYLEYSDNHGFAGSQSVEIIHRFTLPEGAVVNDLWLWIGNQVMKGLILDTWTARGIYDSSIIPLRVDPALLTKRGNQYELKVYPLISGQTRKIKMNIIVPNRWNANSALVELPFRYFNASGGTTLPVDIMFRVKENVWGTPVLKEIPSSSFNFVTDTLGYSYRKYKIINLMSLNSLHISYQTNFTNGAFFSNNYVNNLGNYYQIGFVPRKLMDIDSMERPPQKVVVGIDLSGDFGKSYPTLMPKLKSVLNSSLKEGDSFKLMIAGAGRVKSLQEEWGIYSAQNVNSVLDSFVSSSFGDSVAVRQRPVINYADVYAKQMWSYPDIELVADTQNYTSLENTIPFITRAYTTAAYQYGYENTLSDSSAAQVREKLDSLFLFGGRFLTYYDRNRIGREKIAKYYIPSLGIQYNTNNAVTLFRTEGGNISAGFPVVHERNGGYFFSFNDSTVVKELVDINGNACVISKRMGNGGLLIVSGIWAFNDNAALRKLMANVLLGLSNSSGNTEYQLKNMLTQMRGEAVQDSGMVMMVFSNSDSLVNQNGLQAWTEEYLAPLTGKRIKIRSVNLLDGADVNPQYYSLSGNNYFGSGYLMKKLADETYGIHFETHQTSWNTVANLLAPSVYPLVDSISLQFTFSAGGDTVLSMSPLNNFLINPDQPVIYIGEVDATYQMTANFAVRFEGLPNVYTKSLTYDVSLDTTKRIVIIPSILGYERLKLKLFNSPWDTAAIVNEAVKFNLVSDYTALLCLEPNDTIRPLINPFDESGLVPVELTSFTIFEDSSCYVLEWVVNSEQNNRGFRVEKFFNGLGVPLGFISGRGTTLQRHTYRFVDNGVEHYAVSPIRYMLYQIDMDGTERIIAEKEIIPSGMPVEYSLSQNYPNPFNPVTTIAYGVKEKGHVVLTVYDILGNKVAEIVNAVKDRGRYTAKFDGSRFSSGVYFYTLQVNGFTQTKKLTLLK